MFVLAWEYLTGKAVASTWNDRSAPEWPPHPDRAFQSLVAAWGETGQDEAQAAALRWLEALPSPCMHLSGEDFACSERPVYVPTNDLDASVRTREYSPKMLALLPGQRGKALRHFPATAYAGTCALTWPDSEPDAVTLAALRALCARVTHVGHSSSLVRMWVAEDAPPPTYAPSPDIGDLTMRVPHRGRLEALASAYADGGAAWQRPPVARWQRYARIGTNGRIPPASLFGEDWTVLRRVAGVPFGLAQAPAMAEALRGTLLKAADGDALAMAILSGHAPDGAPSDRPHAAFVPLGFVDEEQTHADGHLLGIAIVLPRGSSYEERDACLRALVAAGDAESGAITLVFGPAGTCTLVAEDREQPPHTLRPATWCGSAVRWASVTPIALDRLPPRRHEDREAWAEEQVALACERVGLPRPASVRTQPVSRFAGAPHCRAFPPLKRRHDGGPRWHVHAEIGFAERVHGPLLLGAGRYRGYGICRPLRTLEDVAQSAGRSEPAIAPPSRTEAP